MIGSSPAFVQGDDPATISVAVEHPAKALLLQAIQALDRGHVRVAVECMTDAMTEISVTDGQMCEF